MRITFLYLFSVIDRAKICLETDWSCRSWQAAHLWVVAVLGGYSHVRSGTEFIGSRWKIWFAVSCELLQLHILHNISEVCICCWKKRPNYSTGSNKGL